MENKTEKQITNPRNYGYPQGTKVEIEGFIITDLITIFERLTNEEIKAESKFKYNFINEKGKIVKSPKQEDLATGKVKKILDFERTVINPTLEYSLSEKGLAYAELKNFLEGIHFQNIQKGIAVEADQAPIFPLNTGETEAKKD
jgi:hypothetical protein